MVGIGGLGSGELGSGKLGSEKLGSGGLGLGGVPYRDTNPSPTPTVFQAADPYSTSHVLRQIVFASSRLRAKSLASSLFASNRSH